MKHFIYIYGHKINISLNKIVRSNFYSLGLPLHITELRYLNIMSQIYNRE